MSEERPEGLNPDAERKEKRLKHPDDKVKDLDAPPEEAEDIRGGFIKMGIQGESQDDKHP
jgi:hypothetical protein